MNTKRTISWAVILIVAILVLPVLGASAKEEGSSAIPKAEVLSKASKLHIPFIPNQGQMDERVKYYARSFGGTVFVTEVGEIFYSLPKREKGKTLTGWVLKEELLGGRVKGVKGQEEASARVSYFIGNDASQWRSDLSTYGSVSLGEVYEGIEVKLRAYGRSVEKFFYVRAGVEPGLIRLRLSGAESLSVNKKGELEVRTGLGGVKFSRPVAYQEVEGGRRYVEVSYQVEGSEYGFKLGDYERGRGLVIDPLLQSTYLGGSGDDEAHSIAIDSDGNIYVAGYTGSANFPGTAGGAQPSYGMGEDAFVTKLNSTLTTILQSTYLGGSGSDHANSIAIGSDGNVYVGGSTYSTDFPGTAGGAQPSKSGGYDTFVTKLDPTLTTLLQSTYLGGSSNDYAYAIAIDSDGNVYVGGYTYSTDFPGTAGGARPDFGGEWGSDVDSFVTKLNPDLTSIVQSTYLGSDLRYARSIALDSGGNVIVAGYTGATAFVTKLNSDLTAIVQSTHLGGTGGYSYGGYSVAIDSAGNVYVGGYTQTTNFPGTAGGAQPSFGGGYFDAFVTKLDPTLTTIVQSTYLGGSGYDYVFSIAIDSGDNVYVAGWTTSADFPGTEGGAIPSAHFLFVTKLNPDLTSIVQSTYLGGSLYAGTMPIPIAPSIALDSGGNVYVAGYTGSTNFPGTAGGAQCSYGGGHDAFVAKFDSSLAEPVEPPDAPTLISPSGPITTTTPTYTWDVVPTSTWYQLCVGDSTGDKILQWYSAAAVCCAGTCSVTPATALAPGSWTWWIQAENFAGAGPWSIGMEFVVEGVSKPNIPGGPNSGKNNTSYTYSLSGSTSNIGHPIQYFLDWGDGTNTGWLPVGTTSASKSWASVGTYPVKAQARCATHTSIVSPWSGNLYVSIENVSDPATPSGHTSGIGGASYGYFAGGSSSDIGDSIQYLFDWGDGTNSGWLPVGTTSASKSWASVGTYSLKAQARCATHTSNVSNWSNSLSVIITSPLSAVTLVSPSGTINDTTPTYTWNAVSAAKWYRLYVNDSTGNRISQWYAAEDAGCASGTGTCSVTPATVLTPGACRWRIQTWNSEFGGGTWSSSMLFTVVLVPPAAATLVSPSGTIITNTPTYTWNAVSDATWYQLYVNDSTGQKIQQWYTADACGCASGTGTCMVTPTIEVIGSCQWYIQTYGSGGFGPWSLPDMSFTAPSTAPLAATLVSPSGGPFTDTTPTYTWNAVSDATWYQLYVNDSTGKKIQQWYTADACGCASGTGTCTVTPIIEAIGSCQWYIQTYNGAGFGLWSLPGMSFITSPPTNPPAAATQISPSGETATNTPTYTWNGVSTATWYWLYVNDSTGNNKISQWYAASDANCPDGTGICSVTPSVALSQGEGQWWVHAYNSAGYGPWSPGMSFVILTQNLYDDFAATSINKDKWGQGELVREIRGGELVSKATAYGSKMINNLDFKNPASITYLEADVMTDQIEGDYDPDDAANYSLPNARIAGFFYNDGTSSGPGSHKGEVQGIIRIMLYRGELKAQWDVEKSLDNEATSWETLGSGIFPDIISLGIPYKLSIQFEPSLKRFTFKLGTLTSTLTSTDTINPSNTPWKAIGTDVSFFPTTPSPYYGKVSSTFAHVIAKDESGTVLVSDDFSSSTLDSSKWATYELVREISGEKLRSKVRSSSATTSPVHNNLDFLYPSSVDFIQVNVTPLIYQNSQGAQAVARIAGAYYNDGTGTGIPGDHTGDVGAQVLIGGTASNPLAIWMVSRSADSAGQVPEAVASETFATPITLGNTYTLSLGWDGSRFTFRINNEEATYPPATAINPPNVPWKAIGTRIWDPAGKEATIEALFDDVVVYSGTPSAATLVSPSGTIIDTTPTYIWNAVSDSTWYQLWVNDSAGNKIQKWYKASDVGCTSGTDTCSVTPTIEVGGSCQWKVQTYNPAGFGPWSDPLEFTTPIPTLPPPPALILPSGETTDTTPTYTWDAISGATWYHLYVKDSTDNKINQWYTADACGCASGTGTCSITPTTEVIGSSQWWLQAYNSVGIGPWGGPLSFTTPVPTVPIAATLVSPSGTITDTTPTYIWNAISNATRYCLYVNDSTGNKINQWYTAAQASCASGMGTCFVTPTTDVLGSCKWWIQTYNTAGFGPWSDPLSFTVSP